MASTVGIEKIRVAVLNDDETVDKNAIKGSDSRGIFEIDARTSMGATKATISGLAPESNRIWGSNESVGVSTRGTGQVSVSMGANSIPMEVLAVLTGMEKDASGAYTLGSHSRAPMAVVDVISTEEKTNKPVHFGVLKGMFAPEENNMETNNSSIQRTTDTLTFTGLNRTSDGLVYSALFESQPDADVNKYDEFVFPQAQNGSSVVPAPQPHNGGDNK